MRLPVSGASERSSTSMRPGTRWEPRGVLQSEKILDLRGGDQQRDAVGESDGHGARNVFDRRAQAGEAHDQQQHAGHDAHQRQPGHTELGHDAGDNHHERARGPADLGARAAQRRDQEAGHHRGVQAGLRRHAGGDGKRHRHGQRHQAHRHSGDQVLEKLSARVAAQALDRAGKARFEKAQLSACAFAPACSHFVQHSRRLFQLGVEIVPHQLQNFNDRAVAHGVEHLVAGLAIDHKLLGAQHAQVLRDVGLLHAQLFNEHPGRKFAVAQQFEDGDAGRVGKGLKDISLKLPQSIWHI